MCAHTPLNAQGAQRLTFFFFHHLFGSFFVHLTHHEGYYSPINAGFWVVSPSCVDYNAIVDIYADGFDQPSVLPSENTTRQQQQQQQATPCTPAGCGTGLGWGAFGAQSFCGSLHCGMGCWHARAAPSAEATEEGNATAAAATTTPTFGSDELFLRGYNFTNCSAAPGASHDWDFHGASADQGLLLSHFILQRRSVPVYWECVLCRLSPNTSCDGRVTIGICCCFCLVFFVSL